MIKTRKYKIYVVAAVVVSLLLFIFGTDSILRRYIVSTALMRCGGSLKSDPMDRNAMSRLAFVLRYSWIGWERSSAAGQIAGSGRSVLLQSDYIIPVLIDALRDDDPHVQWMAILALGEAGIAARPAIPELIKIVKNRPGWSEGVAAIELLGQIAYSEDPEVLDILQRTVELHHDKLPEAKRAILLIQQRCRAINQTGGPENEAAPGPENGSHNGGRKTEQVQ